MIRFQQVFDESVTELEQVDEELRMAAGVCTATQQLA